MFSRSGLGLVFCLLLVVGCWAPPHPFLHVDESDDTRVHGDLIVDGDIISGGTISAVTVIAAENLISGGDLEVGGSAHIEEEVVADEFIEDETPDDDDDDPPPPPPPPPAEVEELKIIAEVKVTGTLQVGQEVVITVPTNGGDGSVSFKFLDMALPFTVFVEDGVVTFPPSPQDRFAIDSGGVISIKNTLTLSGTGRLSIWANDGNFLDPPEVINIPMTVVP